MPASYRSLRTCLRFYISSHTALQVVLSQGLLVFHHNQRHLSLHPYGYETVRMTVQCQVASDYRTDVSLPQLRRDSETIDSILFNYSRQSILSVGPYDSTGALRRNIFGALLSVNSLLEVLPSADKRCYTLHSLISATLLYYKLSLWPARMWRIKTESPSCRQINVQCPTYARCLSRVYADCFSTIIHTSHLALGTDK